MSKRTPITGQTDPSKALSFGSGGRAIGKIEIDASSSSDEEEQEDHNDEVVATWVKPAQKPQKKTVDFNEILTKEKTAEKTPPPAKVERNHAPAARPDYEESRPDPPRKSFYDNAGAYDEGYGGGGGFERWGHDRGGDRYERDDQYGYDSGRRYERRQNPFYDTGDEGYRREEAPRKLTIGGGRQEQAEPPQRGWQGGQGQEEGGQRRWQRQQQPQPQPIPSGFGRAQPEMVSQQRVQPQPQDFVVDQPTEEYEPRRGFRVGGGGAVADRRDEERGQRRGVGRPGGSGFQLGGARRDQPEPPERREPSHREAPPPVQDWAPDQS